MCPWGAEGFARYYVPLGREQSSGNGLTVVSPAPRDAWRRLLRLDPTANIYQTPEWLDAACEVDGYVDCSRLYTTAGGAQVVVPMVRRRGVPRYLAIQESLPARWGTGGFVSDAPVRVSELVSILAELRGCGAARIRMRPEGWSDHRWSVESAVPG